MQDADLPLVYLKPAEWLFSRKPARVTTVLGSCVSVTMFHPGTKTGAICHALLPGCRYRGKSSWCGYCSENGRYVDCIVPMMLKQFRHAGISISELELKLFGGSNMFDSVTGFPERQSVGNTNVLAALKVIHGEEVNLVNSSYGGRHGRKLFFYPHTGVVFLKHLKRK